MKRFLPYVLLLLMLPAAFEAQTKRPLPQLRQTESQAKTKTRRQNLTPRQIAAIAFPSSVSVYVTDKGGDSYSGAGFIVAPNLVVTCFHVVENPRRIVVTPIGFSEDHHNAQLLRYDEDTDVALLSVKTLRGKPLRITKEIDFYIGEPIYTLGNPKGLEGTFSNGIISNFLRVDDTIYMQFTAPISPGNSGGPALNQSGEVIGMVNMQVREGQNLNFAVLAIHIQMLMAGRRGLPPDSYIDNDLGSPTPRRKPD